MGTREPARGAGARCVGGRAGALLRRHGAAQERAGHVHGLVTPALISGAFVERMKFSAYALFILLWTTRVYDPVAYWTWAEGGWLLKLGVLDFAGGTVVHWTAGLSALLCALYVGKRVGYGRERFIPQGGGQGARPARHRGGGAHGARLHPARRGGVHVVRVVARGLPGLRRGWVRAARRGRAAPGRARRGRRARGCSR
jgi:ammonium transporter family